MTAAQRNVDLPRPTAFKAIVLGLLAFGLITTFIQLAATAQGPDFRPAWQAPVEWLFAIVFFGCLPLLWFRQGWAFYVFCAMILMKIAIMFMIAQMAALPSIVLHLITLGLLFWGLHAGGVGSMWQQMFGGAATGSPGAYGFRPAIPPAMSSPPAMAPSPAAPPMPPRSATPAPATPASAAAAPAAVLQPAADPYEQLRKLAGLRDAGLLTAAEFDAKKTELLKRL